MLPNRYKWQIKTNTVEDSIINQILVGRGLISNQERENFLNPSKMQLCNPFLLNDMDIAVKRIQLAKERKEHIVVYGDYDVDGITSTSILYMFLKEQGYDVSYYIPNRIDEGYGINKGALDKIKQYSQLIITVDTGIAANEEIEHANKIGLDVIITDHHECQEQLPKAYCILNPKRPDTTYPFQLLAGVGVTFKLIHGIAIEENAEDKIWKYLDIVAIGTVADVVSLEGENRVLTSLGFKQMESTEHVGVKAMLNIVQLDGKKISSGVIGFQIGPRINAAGRIGDALLGVKLLTTKDDTEANTIAQKLDVLNKERQEMEHLILKEAEKYIEENVDLKNDLCIIVLGEEWHHGVIGIVASRIQNKYYKPTIVLTKEDGVYSGSARSIEGFNIFEAISTAKEYLMRFGGHEMAAGISLQENQIDKFKEIIKEYSKSHLNDEILTRLLVLDAELEAEDVSLKLCEDIERLEPMGLNNPTPIFSVKGTIQYTQTLGQEKKHLKIALQNKNNVFHCIGFDKGYLVDYLTEGEEIVLACEISKNVWNGKTSLQLRIKDIVSPEETVFKSCYYKVLYEYLPEPKVDIDEPLELIKTTDTCSNYLAFTEVGVKSLMKNEYPTEKIIKKIMGICYNEHCDFEKQSLIEWDFKHFGQVYCMNTTLKNHKEQVVYMVPTASDCREIYKFLKLSKDKIYLHSVVERFKMRQMTEYKIFQILNIFKELSILDYHIQDGEICYQIHQINKTQLEKSLRYIILQKYAHNMKNELKSGGTR
ncbi:MAG: single-stranded-DNA-specific exonuclease RecJ [Cellulosilyticaceae bacterium]